MTYNRNEFIAKGKTLDLFAKEKKLSLGIDTKEAQALFRRLNIDSRRVTNGFSENKILLKKIQQDAAVLHSFLTPSLYIHKNSGTRLISELKGEAAKHAVIINPPDAIFIFGNNDLMQVEHIGGFYKKLTCQQKDKSLKIFISGKGGHGTSQGPVFCYPEATTMKRFLMECGIDEKNIVVENEATNSGENVKNTDSIMQMFENRYDHILISGTPTGILRQIRTYEKQSTYPWKTISVLPQTFDQIQKDYYANYADASVNMFGALREVASFIDYTLNTSFLAPRVVPDINVAKSAFLIYIEYYSRLTNDHFLLKNANKCTDDLLSFMNIQSNNPNHKNSELSAFFKNSIDYFRKTFAFVERETMKNLSWVTHPPKSIIEQSLFLPKVKTKMDQYGLDISINCIKM